MNGTTTVLMTQRGQIIWFDAILNYTRSFEGEVTRHPIERGGVVADHVTNDNPTFSINGVISDADWNLDRLTNESLDSIKTFVESGEDPRIMNDSPQTEPAEIQYKENPLTKFVPEIAQGILNQQAPVIVMEEAYKYRTAIYMEQVLTELQRGKEELMIIEFKDGIARNFYQNCIITGLSYTDDPESGIEVIYPQIQIKSVRWVESELVKVPKRVTEKLKKKVEPKQNKGAQTGTKTEAGPAAPTKRVSGALEARRKATGVTTP